MLQVFTEMPVLFLNPLRDVFGHFDTPNEHSEEPEGVIADVVGTRAEIGENGQNFEENRPVSLDDLGQPLNLIEKPKETEHFPGRRNILLQVVIDDHIQEFL